MSLRGIRQPIVVAIAPFVRGVGFVVFSGPWMPIDWGIKWTEADKNPRSLAKVGELLERYEPDMLVFEDHAGEGSRRSGRVRRLLDAIEELAQKKNIATNRYSRARIRNCFSEFGAVTKHDIAEAIAKEFPEFGPRLPVKRKIWLPEHPNMSIFDAAALALTFFSMSGRTGEGSTVTRFVRRLAQRVTERAR